MVAGSLLALALSLVAAPPEGSGPPTITLDELNAFVEAGNYHRIRVEKLGQRFEATGTVEGVAADNRWLIVDMPGHLRAALQELPEDHGLAVGDRVRFDGLIVDEGYACLQIWTYDFKKLSPQGSADDAEEEKPHDQAAPSGESAPVAASYARILKNAATAKSSEELLPKATPADLDATGEIAVRREMVGLRLDADAVVEAVGAWPLVRLNENWQAHLHGHFRHDLKPGDRIRVVGLICDEAYTAVSVWVERVEKRPK